MSLATLIALSRNALEPLTDEQKERLKEARIRMEQFDKECEQRVRDKIPTQEQLNKVVNWGTLYG
jgi:hypothetical protein